MACVAAGQGCPLPQSMHALRPNGLRSVPSTHLSLNGPGVSVLDTSMVPLMGAAGSDLWEPSGAEWECALPKLPTLEEVCAVLTDRTRRPPIEELYKSIFCLRQQAEAASQAVQALIHSLEAFAPQAGGDVRSSRCRIACKLPLDLNRALSLSRSSARALCLSRARARARKHSLPLFLSFSPVLSLFVITPSHSSHPFLSKH